MKVSQKGIDLIIRFESLSLVPYQDSIGVWTIGYGHTTGVNINSKSISRREAYNLLQEDLKPVEIYINNHFTLNQNQFDALASLLFNIGTDFGKYKLYKLLLNNPDDKHISDEWIQFRNAGDVYLKGLLLRRLNELILFYS